MPLAICHRFRPPLFKPGKQLVPGFPAFLEQSFFYFRMLCMLQLNAEGVSRFYKREMNSAKVLASKFSGSADSR